jgi:DNA-binding response OmpR family regulator
VATFKVLIIDDSRFNRELIKDLLQSQGFDADAVGDIEAFDKALTWWKPTSVIIDVNMPRESGIDVARRVRDASPDIPVVLMSAMPIESLRLIGKECEADDCFSTLDGFAGVVDCLYQLYDRKGL